MLLRPYQTDAIGAVLAAARSGQHRQLLAMPCGCGKTVVFVEVAKLATGRVLALVHRTELIEQTVAKLIDAGVDPADVGVVKAERNEIECRYVVASVQTLARPNRLEQLDPAGISLLIIDEAHHATAASYLQIIDHVAAKLVLGVTATPERADGDGLDVVFGDKAVHTYPLRDAIADGWLVPPRQYSVKTDADLETVRSRCGDFVTGELSRVVNTPARNKRIVESWATLGGKGRRSVAFSVDIQHAHDLAAEFAAQGFRSAPLSGKTPSDDRALILSLLASGDLDIVTNCAVLTEGWDCPELACVVMARPTKSRPLYTQCVGRGLRLADGKDDCLILDFADNAKRHKLVTIAELFGTKTGDWSGLTLPEVEQRDHDNRPKLPGGPGRRRIGIEAEEVEAIGPACLDGYQPYSAWQYQAATHKQIGALSKAGIDTTGRRFTKGEAAYLLDKHYSRRNAGPPTGKQKWFLRCNGHDADGMTFAQASELIGEIKGGVPA